MIECTFERGTAANLRHVVVDALLIQDNQVLLTRRAERLREGGKWAIPGGFMDRDETTLEAVMREVLEETGYTCEIEQLLTVLDKPDRRGDDRQNVSFVFVAKPIAKVQEHDDEVTELKWFPLDALPAAAEMAFDHLEIIWEWIKENDEGLDK
ncbi:MAG: NUDIX domain-containing protein [Candidatus Kerfeldbacteria bacterium]|nr:NUDIX domain-containing protein [Candidatus Kerfeldbacteria bacterium]